MYLLCQVPIGMSILIGLARFGPFMARVCAANTVKSSLACNTFGTKM